MYTNIGGTDLIDKILDSTREFSSPWKETIEIYNKNKDFIDKVIYADLKKGEGGELIYTFLAAGVSKDKVEVKDTGSHISVSYCGKVIYKIENKTHCDHNDIKTTLKDGILNIIIKGNKRERIIPIS